MLNWAYGFEGVILGRGKKCYKDGGIVGLRRGPQAWEALAVGTKLYRVQVGIGSGQVSDLQCNCPYAKKEGPCKQMAALFCALEVVAPELWKDDDAALSGRLDGLSTDEAEDLLQLAIDLGSTRCTALLLNHKAAGDAPRFSLDEFTLDDLPADALGGRSGEIQGDNGPLKLLARQTEGKSV